jgi:hypothetical protein
LKLFLGENGNYLAKQKVAQNVPNFFWLLQLAKKSQNAPKLAQLTKNHPISSYLYAPRLKNYLEKVAKPIFSCSNSD